MGSEVTLEVVCCGMFATGVVAEQSKAPDFVSHVQYVTVEV